MDTNNKSKGIAILLALLLGGIGGHKFYLDKTKQGILYLIFFWTFIPTVLSLLDIVTLLVMNKKTFNTKYNFKNDSGNDISKLKDLEKFASLKERGHLTEEEFLKKKAELL